MNILALSFTNLVFFVKNNSIIKFILTRLKFNGDIKMKFLFQFFDELNDDVIESTAFNLDSGEITEVKYHD